MTERPVDRLDTCPRCGRPTLLETPTPHGQRVCLRCGIVSLPDSPEEQEE